MPLLLITRRSVASGRFFEKQRVRRIHSRTNFTLSAIRSFSIPRRITWSRVPGASSLAWRGTHPPSGKFGFSNYHCRIIVIQLSQQAPSVFWRSLPRFHAWNRGKGAIENQLLMPVTKCFYWRPCAMPFSVLTQHRFPIIFR